jgi:hypothetical protein
MRSRPHGHSTSKAPTFLGRFSGDRILTAVHSSISTTAQPSSPRILHTLAIGEVSSKRIAGEWALHAVDPAWAPLIRWALEERPDPWTKVREPADSALVRRTRQFIDYAAGLAAEH